MFCDQSESGFFYLGTEMLNVQGLRLHLEVGTREKDIGNIIPALVKEN